MQLASSASFAHPASCAHFAYLANFAFHSIHHTRPPPPMIPA